MAFRSINCRADYVLLDQIVDAGLGNDNGRDIAHPIRVGHVAKELFVYVRTSRRPSNRFADGSDALFFGYDILC